MAEQLFWLGENLFSLACFPNDPVPTANEEATGYTVDRVANGRRQAGDRWQSTTANADAYIQRRFNTPRGANCCIIDRASNHMGETFNIKGSSDNFTTSRTVSTFTVPLAPGGSLTSGCLTDEDAFIITFTTDVHNDWRVTSVAMGSGIVPQLTQVYLGFAFMPTERFSSLPDDDEGYDVTSARSESPYGWEGHGAVASPRSGEYALRHRDERYYDHVRLWMLGTYRRLFPCWFIPRRTDYPSRAMQVICPNGRLNWAQPHPLSRTFTLPWREDQPRVA